MNNSKRLSSRGGGGGTNVTQIGFFYIYNLVLKIFFIDGGLKSPKEHLLTK